MDPETKRRIFDTPLSVQRYEWVKQYLIANPHIKSLTDFGCGNGKILNWFKNAPNLEHINFVDSDLYLLEQELNYNFQPIQCEMIFGRDCSIKDLNIEVYHANVSVPDDRLKADCITMVEVIEHMPLDEVERATRAIFGYYQPGTVIITTPNSEFNHLLQSGPRPTKFRHCDHKFEWTRQEFAHWVQTVCSTYPYSCRLDGVGHLPNSEPYGPCTQIAVFTRRENIDSSVQKFGIADEASKDLHCVDLLLNKLNVKESVPDWQFDAGQKKVSKVVDYTIPGRSKTKVEPVEPFDWGLMDVN